MAYAAAGPGEVLRSVQKDELYSGQLWQLAAGLGLDLCGPAAWLRWDRWAEPAVRWEQLQLGQLAGYPGWGIEWCHVIKKQL